MPSSSQKGPVWTHRHAHSHPLALFFIAFIMTLSMFVHCLTRHWNGSVLREGPCCFKHHCIASVENTAGESQHSVNICRWGEWIKEILRLQGFCVPITLHYCPSSQKPDHWLHSLPSVPLPSPSQDSYPLSEGVSMKAQPTVSGSCQWPWNECSSQLSRSFRRSLSWYPTESWRSMACYHCFFAYFILMCSL